MTSVDQFSKIRSELEAGMQLPKCLKCGCMHNSLRNLTGVVRLMSDEIASVWRSDLAAWTARLRPVRYGCLGCDYCYPAVAQNLFSTAFPEIAQPSLSCDFQVDEKRWPPVVGEYMVVNRSAPVAVSTLASVVLAEELATRNPTGLAIVGKTETENIGIDKIIKNVITNPVLGYLVVCGQETQGHQTGQTLLAFARNGIDDQARVIASRGKRPFLRNVSRAEIEQFRAQVQVIDMIGCQDLDRICDRVETLAAASVTTCGCDDCHDPATPAISTTNVTWVTEPSNAINLDKAGYFVILPLADKGVINVEYYDYADTLQGVIEGQTARAIYLNIIDKGWVTELSHAAYVGKELAKAELSLVYGFKYVQDGA